jgi:hypothetical protein
VIGRDDGSEIVLRDMRSLIDAELADGCTAVLRGIAAAARDRAEGSGSMASGQS